MELARGLVAIAAAMSVLGGTVTGIYEGKVAIKAVEMVAKNPEAANEIRSTMIIGDAVSETCAIYCLLIAILLIFVY